MPRMLPTPDRLLDRTWRAGHPFRPRLSVARRMIMWIFLIVLVGLIGAYWYLTDSIRVRSMAQDYLSRLSGGHVEIGKATLSIFEGLRLDDVSIYVDEHKQEDSLLFSASTFTLEYSPTALLTGNIEATRIVAIDPRVRLSEDVNARQWNYQRMRKTQRDVKRPSAAQKQLILPEVLLRNAQIEYTRIRDSRIESRGVLNIDGQLSPAVMADRYFFKLQSRSTASLGPQMQGSVSLTDGDITARMAGFQFGSDIKSLLPDQVRTWWEDHGLSGSIDIPDFNANLIRPDQPFAVKVVLVGVKLTVQPEEMMSRDEVQKRQWLDKAFGLMRTAGLNERGFIDHIGALVQPGPIALSKVDGTFIFTDKGIELQDVIAGIEDNLLKISGRIDGYKNDVPFALAISSLDTQNIYLPPSPKYINSMPPGVREVYNRFRPVGTASLAFRIDRESAGGRPEVAGEVKILDGQFAFEKFPYPVRKATGTIRIDRDPVNGQEYLKIINLRGTGVKGGPNEKAYLEVNGEMGPFASDIGVQVNVRGTNISSEPALIAAFPPKTRSALKLFDAEGKGEYPRFRGSFSCDIERYRTVESIWRIETDVTLDAAAGTLVAFPYPMKGVTAAFTVYDDYVELRNAHYVNGDATLDIWGRIDWGDKRLHRTDAPQPAAAAHSDSLTTPTTRPSLPMSPDLHLRARNVSIDNELLAALPPMQQKWLVKLGVQGKFDLDGTVRSRQVQLATGPKDDIDFDFDVQLHNASLWPMESMAAVSGVNGMLHLTPDKLTLTDLTGKRGESQVKARGSVAWATKPPQIAIVAEASDLKLDSSLYQILPAAAKKGWDEVRPEGSVDAKLTFSGQAEDEPAAGTQPSSRPATSPIGYELVLTPRSLKIFPQSAPYRLENVTGEMLVTQQRVEFRKVTGTHGDAKIELAATGALGEKPVWDFQLIGTNVPVDDEFRAAVPGGLAELMKSSHVSGKIDFDFTRLRLAFPASSATTQATQPAAHDLDADFTVNLQSHDLSIDIGVPITKVDGGVAFSGLSQHGKLTDLAGVFDLKSFSLGDRTVRDFRAQLKKVANEDAMMIKEAQAKFAGGELAGQAVWAYPEKGPSRYATNLVLRSADVAEITGDAAPQMRGQLSASLALEGNFNDPRSRRGRGDVVAQGEEMYRIPVMLGLLQVTNLALPITSPFSEATCRYSVDGNRVTFESIELRAKEMMMQGSGNLDFDKMKVRLSFVTESINWLKVPFVGDLIQGARNELLQIQVRGSIEKPKVSASSMNTLTTTVDEVFRGSGAEQGKK